MWQKRAWFSKQIPGRGQTHVAEPAPGIAEQQPIYEKSLQRLLSVDRLRSGSGMPAPMETNRRSQTENGCAPGDSRGKGPASGGSRGESQTIGEATLRIQIGSAKSDA